MAVAEVPPLPDGDDKGEADTAPAGKQFRIDGMPVSDEYVVITGRIRVSRAVIEKWKLGKKLDLTMATIYDSRKAKVKRNGPEATGELEQQHVVQVVDLILDEE